MDNVLKFTSGKNKNFEMEVQGVQVMKLGDDFEFNYQTSRDPNEKEIEVLKAFRNNFVLELKKTNFILSEVNK